MKKQGLFLTLVLILDGRFVMAHDSTDWRNDKKAFAAAKDSPVSRREPIPLSVVLPGISSDFLKHKLSEISGAKPVMIEGMQVTIPERRSGRGRELTMKYLAQEYRALGYTVGAESFSGGNNFIAERAGSDPTKYLILSSHIDSVGNAGANDDGSGTISALAIAYALKDLKIKHSLRIVGFDREEVGLVGSAAYTQNLKNRNDFLGNIQLEMMATNSRLDGRFHVIDCDRADSKFLSQKIMNAIANLKLPLKRVSACTERSDHASFWQENLAAVVISENFFGDDGDTCYHAACDQVNSRLDFEYMNGITTATAHATAELLGASATD